MYMATSVSDSSIKLGGFIMAGVVSIAVIGLSITQLIRGVDTSMYIGMLSTVFGIWMTSPTSLINSISTTHTVTTTPATV